MCGHYVRLAAVALASVCLLSAWVARTCAASDADMTLERLIELVRQNELLYKEIDVTITDRYETTKMPPKAVTGRAISGIGTFKIIQAEHSQERYVAQGDWYRVDARGWWDYARDDRQAKLLLREYDGQTTRSLQGKVGNLVHGYRPCDLPIYAHSLFERMVGRIQLLSSYLSGEEPGPVSLQGGSPPEGLASSQYRGQSDHNGEACYEVERTLRGIGGEGGQEAIVERLIIWLSKERNLIPVGFVAYDPESSTTIPVAQGTVKSWIEVEPGIWFPKELEYRVLDRYVLRDTGKQVLAWRRTYTVDEVSLKPAHPISFFRTITFPEGTFVYEFEGEKYIRGYGVGSPQDPNVAKGKQGSIHRWLLWAIGFAAVVASIAVIFWVRRHRKERVCTAAI